MTQPPVAGTRPRHRRTWWWGLLAIAALIAASVLLGAVVRAPRRPPNLLIVLIDTLRFDRLGAYGSQRGLTPFLDAFAAGATVFQRVYAQSSWTLPSVASLFTSRYQSQHGVIGFTSVLGNGELALAEVLQQHGYATAAITANFLMREDLGIAQGFEAFEKVLDLTPTVQVKGHKSDIAKGRAVDVTSAALGWLDAQHERPDRPVLLYLHYMDVHAPYDPLPAALDRVLGGRPRPDRARANTAVVYKNWPPSPADVQAASELYDAELTALDDQLRDLFDGLAARGFLDHCVVVVTADHGEEFGDHGFLGHGETLYEEVIRVPLMIHLPGQRRRADVPDPVSLIDVAPTLLDLAGIAAPPSFEGRSLAGRPPREAGGWSPRTRAAVAAPPPSIVSELLRDPSEKRRSPHERAAIEDTAKLITGVDGEQQFFDLGADPGEHGDDPLSAAAQRELRAVLERFGAHTAASSSSAETVGALDEQTRERMRALGYQP